MAGIAAALEPLSAAAGLTPLPLLHTDLIVDPYQLYESPAGGGRRCGADRGGL